MRKITKWLCSVLLVAAIGLTGCGQKQKTESTAEKSNENHFVGECYERGGFVDGIAK